MAGNDRELHLNHSRQKEEVRRSAEAGRVRRGDSVEAGLARAERLRACEERLNRLVLKARQGDEPAFNELMQIYYPRVFNICYNSVKHREHAEDVAAEVFAKAWQRLRRFQVRYENANRKFAAWLRQIAKNHCTSRSRTRRLETISLDEPYEDYEDGEELKPLIEALIDDTAPDPQDEAERRQIAGTMREGVDQLPDEQKTVVRLLYLEGLTVREAAKWLGVPSSTVQYRNKKALDALRDFMRQKGYDIASGEGGDVP